MTVLGMGPIEVLVILLVAFIVLGPERAIDAGRMLGKATREIRRFTESLPDLTLSDNEDPRPDGQTTTGDADSKSGAFEQSSASEGSEGAATGSNGAEGPVSFRASDTTPRDEAEAPGQQEKQ